MRIDYSSDGFEWTQLHNPLAENKTEKHDEKYIFEANKDQNSIKNIKLQMRKEDDNLGMKVVRANIIRIYPLEWVGYPCLRFEAYFK